MKRLGYACLTKTLDNVTSSSSLSYTNYLKNENKLQKLDEVIISNLEDLEKIIDYNIANDIHFYRLSSKIIPLATHKDVEFDYIDKYQNFYDRIGEKNNQLQDLLIILKNFHHILKNVLLLKMMIKFLISLIV